ncbi:hypothetical protein GCM10011416_14800 [Polaribacter pacificus]|uniref:MerR HTH family regulatory protein n=1 Tax=Polaribacter pacificus TaxID=1775173 RepID=A0A917I096_9FLAO|nr:chaperone modulator CbpM [Polaribacter pacificus]GGG97802.1 hypothetical protein GCM10011416_14800 [Polaribacter pacificus]
MSLENFIPLDQLCTHYKVEMSFFTSLNDYGLIEITTIEESCFVHKEKTGEIEKMIRMHQELNINFEGIDTIFNLLKKIETLQSQLINTQNRLRVYED